jgi:hypothetical protein
MFIYSSSKQLEILCIEDLHTFFDATFWVWPDTFYQMASFIVFSPIYNEYFIVLHALMKNKTGKSYLKLFRTVKKLIKDEGYGEWTPKNLYTDIEPAIILVYNIFFIEL